MTPQKTKRHHPHSSDDEEEKSPLKKKNIPLKKKSLNPQETPTKRTITKQKVLPDQLSHATGESFYLKKREMKAQEHDSCKSLKNLLLAAQTVSTFEEICGKQENDIECKVDKSVLG